MSQPTVLKPSRRVDDIIVPKKLMPAVSKHRRYEQFFRARRVLPIAALGFAALIIVLLVFMHFRSSPGTGSAALLQAENEIGRHYLLPTDEQPALVTVEDETKVTSPFLRQAKNGDKLLIYAKAKIVIIYRPSIDRIVAVGPVFIDTSKAAPAQ